MPHKSQFGRQLAKICKLTTVQNRCRTFKDDFHCRANNVRFSALEYLPAKCKSCNELRLKIGVRINKLSSVIFPTIAPSETGRRTTVAFRARVPYKERLPTTGSVGDGWCCMGDSLLNGEDVHGPDAAEAGDDSPRRYWLMP
jgi:hypothetical protein